MMKKILILEGSPRRNGNSAILSDEFPRGAEEAGCSVEKNRVAGKKVAGCLGCNACYRNGGACVQKDVMAEIQEKMLEADVIALASPIYFYSMTARMKAVIDRTFAFYSQLDGFTCCTPNAKEGGVVPGRNGSRRHSRVESHGGGLRDGQIFFIKNQ